MMQARLRHIIAWPGALFGLALIASGLLLIDNAVQWRLHLLVGLWLLSLPPRTLMPSRPRSIQRNARVSYSLGRLALVLGLGFSAVTLQLVRNQIVYAAEIRERALAILEPVTPEDPADPPAVAGIRASDRTSLGSERTWPVEIDYDQRGVIFDSNGFIVATTQDGRRVYPNPDLGQIVGFQSRLLGLTGIEATYDDYLSGEYSIAPEDFLIARQTGKTPIDTNAANVYLTLDSTLQQAAEAALGNRRGGVALLDPRTGAILALASYPRFDPNQLVLPDPATEADVQQVRATWEVLSARADAPLLNRATQGRYPPGSIIKTLTAAAVIDSGVMPTPASRITCPNRLYTGEVNAPPVRNAVEGLAGVTGNPTTLRRAYAFSCNTAFAQMGLLLGPELFSDYAHRFGLGFASEERSADLQDIAAEPGNIANDPAFLQRPIALADTAFGQGQILISPLDMAQMVGVIANNGSMMRPYLAEEVRLNGEVVYTAQPEVIRQVISPQSAAYMRSIMDTSVDIGYASPVKIRGVSIGGKTGTAEVPYGAPHSWFVAIAPLEQPRFAIAVVVENGGEGSTSALPVARQVLLAAFR
jgi:peptidoglycan glycosyltransferase